MQQQGPEESSAPAAPPPDVPRAAAEPSALGAAAPTETQAGGPPEFKLSRGASWALLLAALLVAVASSWFGARQPPHADMWRPIGPWDLDSAGWWAYPLERNAFKRQIVSGDLRAVFALPDGSQVWAVGNGGLILHSGDGGLTWQQQHPKPPQPARTARGFEWIATAHAQTTKERNVEPDSNKVAPSLPRPVLAPPQGLTVDQKSTPNAPATATPTPTPTPTPTYTPPPGPTPAPTLTPEQAKKADAERAAQRRNTPVPQRPTLAPTARPTAAKAPASAPANAPATARVDPQTADLWSVTFVDAQRGWAVGDGGTVLATRDGGVSWSTQDSDSNVSLYGVSFAADGLRGVAVGEAGTLRLTRDGGQRWTKSSLPLPPVSLFSVAVSGDGARIWLGGARGTLLTSSDGGLNWSAKELGTGLRINAVTMTPDGQRGWIVDDEGVFITTDAGQSWQRADTMLVWPFGLSFAADGRRGWAVGGSGAIHASSDGGRRWAAQDPGANSWLWGVSFAVDGQRGWVVGDFGTLLATHDGGANWTAQASGARLSRRGLLFAADGLRGWSVGDEGTLLATTDGGRTWAPQSTGTRQHLYGLHFMADGQRGWAVGSGGLVLSTRDGGRHWTEQNSGGRALLVDVSLAADGQRGWAAGYEGTLLQTTDGGQTWVEQKGRSGTGWLTTATTFTPDGQRGWSVGTGGRVAFTADGGRTWQEQASGTRATLMGVAIARDGQRGWIIGQQGTLLATTNAGRDWTPRASGTGGALRSLHFTDDGQRGWAVGNDGAVLVSTDAGQTWSAQRSGTRATLDEVFFLPDGQRGWISADDGSVLATVDGGRNWQSVAEYRRHAPPWLFVALTAALLMLGFAIAFGHFGAELRPPPKVPQVLAALLNDSPLTDLRDDRLGHAPAVLALSDFLRNRDTEAKLTLAITAPWGMGKSSMMGMLRGELHKAGFRTAWFNAWHHQQEGRQLSALFNVIGKQAVPSFFSQPFSALRVRTRLLWARGWAYRLAIPLLSVAVLALLVADLDRGRRDSGLSLAELVRWNFAHHWLNEPHIAVSSRTLVKLDPFKPLEAGATPKPPPDPCAPGTEAATRKPDAAVRSEVYCYLRRAVVLQADGVREACGVKQPLIRAEEAQRRHGLCLFENADQLFEIANASIDWQRPGDGARGADPARFLLPSERAAIEAAAEVLKPPPLVPTLEHFLPLLALLGLLMTKGVSVYGLELLKPLRKLLGGGNATTPDVEPTGTVERYRTEFRLLTRALDGRLVVFIDDLDRCDKPTVNGMLEMTNYLIDHGECFIVLGAAMEHVKNCIEPKAPTHEQNLDEYQTEYLRKIVHIELPVPPPGEGALDALLGNGRVPAAAAAAKLPRWSTWLERGARVWESLHAPLTVLAVLALAVALAFWMQRVIRAPTELVRVPALALGGVPVVTPPASAPVATQAAEASTAAPQGPPGEALRRLGVVRSGGSSVVGLAATASTRWSDVAWWLLLAPAVVLLAWWWRRGGPQMQRLKVALGGAVRTQDSPQFMQALALWKTAVRLYDPTPRGLKRFCNRARLFAIHERAKHGPDAAGEVHVVALTAIHHARPRMLDELETVARQRGQRGLWAWIEGSGDSSAEHDPLRDCLRKHLEHFGFADADTIRRFRDLLAQISVR